MNSVGDWQPIERFNCNNFKGSDKFILWCNSNELDYAEICSGKLVFANRLRVQEVNSTNTVCFAKINLPCNH